MANVYNVKPYTAADKVIRELVRRLQKALEK